MLEQKTIASRATLAGVGLHTGREVEVELLPAPADSGVVFVRTDLPGKPRIEAKLENLSSRPRRTALALGTAEVETTEHLLAALFATGVQNLEVRLNGPELPGLDGSSLPYFKAIQSAGTANQGCSARELRLVQPIAVADRRASLVALARDEGLTIGYTLDFGPSLPRRELACPSTQFLELEITEESFAREIAPARTFVLEEEIAQLRAEGLGKGANSENTLVLGHDGIIGNALRFPDEFVRHKILDLIGDLYLMGTRLHGRVLATRSGHALNVKLARQILEAAARNGTGLEGYGDRGCEGTEAARPQGQVDIRQILKLLPHRYPFLLVDRILEIEEGRHAVGLKNVSYNEEYFQGHFADNPVMPGVLLVEAMAQLAGALLLQQGTTKKRTVFLLSLDNVKFRKAVVPGDQVLLEADMRKLRSRTAQVETRAFVSKTIAAEAEMCFVFVEP